MSGRNASLNAVGLGTHCFFEMEETVKLKASLNDQEHELVINEVDGQFSSQVDGRQYEIEVHNSEEPHISS